MLHTETIVTYLNKLRSGIYVLKVGISAFCMTLFFYTILSCC